MNSGLYPGAIAKKHGCSGAYKTIKHKAKIYVKTGISTPTSVQVAFSRGSEASSARGIGCLQSISLLTSMKWNFGLTIGPILTCSAIPSSN